MELAEFFHDLFSNPPSALHQNYVLLGGFILLFGLVSLFVKERLYLTESLVATFVGVLFGPYGFKVVMPEVWYSNNFYHFFREAARIVIGMQVMAAGVTVPGEYLKKNWRSIAMMLGPVMGVMWGISALSIHFALGLPWCESLIIAACVTPTDPVLAHSVIKGKFAERYIPTRLRHLLAVESGANDGLGFPFMMLPIWLLLKSTTSEALHHWAIHTWMWEILMSVVFGWIFGLIARSMLRVSRERKLIDKESFLVFSIALTLFVSGVVALLASDDLLAIFVAGNVFAWDENFVEATEDSHISEVIDMLFNITFFVFFGAVIPWKSFVEFSIMKLTLASVLILLFRRLPIVMMLRPWIGSLQGKKEAFFAGWFGPMGVGAIFFAIQARDIFRAHPDAPVSAAFVDQIFPIVAFIVLSSIMIHGITVPLTNSHLKRRMKRKVKRKNKLAAQLATIADYSTGAISSPTPSEEPDISPMIVHELDEYIYVTDDEDDDGELYDSPIGPSDVVVQGDSEDTVRSRPRRHRKIVTATIDDGDEGEMAENEQ